MAVDSADVRLRRGQQLVTNCEVEARFCELMDKYLPSNSVVLDAGCGQWGLVSHFRSVVRCVTGIDASKEDVKRNVTIDARVVGNVSALPFAEHVFDAVTCQWVIEHLVEPLAFFEELHRVLKPAGTLFIMTPNLLNYETIASRLIPNRYHAPILKRLIGRDEKGTFPTYYRSNTPRSLDRHLAVAGFQRLEMQLVSGMPGFWHFSRLLSLFNQIYERATDTGALRWGKTYLVCVYQRT